MSLKSLIKVADYYNAKYSFEKAAESEEALMSRDFFSSVDRLVDSIKYDSSTLLGPERKRRYHQLRFNEIAKELGEHLSNEEYEIVKTYIDKLINVRIELDEENKMEPKEFPVLMSSEGLDEARWAYIDLRDSKMPEEDY